MPGEATYIKVSFIFLGFNINLLKLTFAYNRTQAMLYVLHLVVFHSAFSFHALNESLPEQCEVKE